MGELPRNSFLLSSQDKMLIDYLGLMPKVIDEKEEANGTASSGPAPGADGGVVISASEDEDELERLRLPRRAQPPPPAPAPAPAVSGPPVLAPEESEEEVFPEPEECQGGLIPGRVVYFDSEDRIVPSSLVTPDMLPTLTHIKLSRVPPHSQPPGPPASPGHQWTPNSQDSPLQCVPTSPGGASPAPLQPLPQTPFSLSPPSPLFFVFTAHERSSLSTPRARKRLYSQRSSSGSSQRFSLKGCSRSPYSPESGRSPASSSRCPFRERPPLRSPPLRGLLGTAASPGNLVQDSSLTTSPSGASVVLPRDSSSPSSPSHADDLFLSDVSTLSSADECHSVCRAASSVFVDHDYLMLAVADIVEVEASPGLSDVDDDTMTPDSLEVGLGAPRATPLVPANARPAYHVGHGLDEDEDESAIRDTDIRPAAAVRTCQQAEGATLAHTEQPDADVHALMGSDGEEQHDVDDVFTQKDPPGEDEDVVLTQVDPRGEDLQAVLAQLRPDGEDSRQRIEGIEDIGMDHRLDHDEVLTQGARGLEQPTQLILAMKSLSFEDPRSADAVGASQEKPELLSSKEPIYGADDLEDDDDTDCILRGGRHASALPSPSKMWCEGAVEASPAPSLSSPDHDNQECVDALGCNGLSSCMLESCFSGLVTVPTLNDPHNARNEEEEVSEVGTPSKMAPNVLSCVMPIGDIQQYDVLSTKDSFPSQTKTTSGEEPGDKCAGMTLSQQSITNDWIVDVEAEALGRFTYYKENTEGELPDILLQDDDQHEHLKPGPAEDAEELQRLLSDNSTSSSSPNRDLDALYLTQCAPLKRKATFKKQKQLPMKKTRRNWEQWYDQFKSVVTTGKQKFLARSTLMSSDNKENEVLLRCDSQSPELLCSQQELPRLTSRNNQSSECPRSYANEDTSSVKQPGCNLPTEMFGTSWKHDESYTGKTNYQEVPGKVKPHALQSGCSFNKSACRQLFKWSAIEPSLKGNDEDYVAVTDKPESDSVSGYSSSVSRARSVVRVGLSKRARPRPLHQRQWWVVGIQKVCVLQ